MAAAAMPSLPPCDFVLTAGGTGGHVLPALAVAAALVTEGVERERIGFLGGLRGVETTAVPAAGLPFLGLPVRGLRRSLAPAALWDNVRAAWAYGSSVRSARRILRDCEARVVCGMGGYASLPAVRGARGAGVPVVVYESNSIPGLATRLGARRAVCTATAFAGTVERVPRGRHIGFLVRPGFGGDAGALRVEARDAYGIPEGRRVVAVAGGSQGARSLNLAVVGLARRWRERGDLAIVHLVGARDFDRLRPEAEAALGPHPALRYVPVAFEERMERVYALADLVVCRSGAATCAELAATATPAICVPYPHAAGDHQRHNAEELAGAGAADVIDDASVGETALAARIDLLLGDPERLHAMSVAAGGLGGADAALSLARLVLEAGGR